MLWYFTPIWNTGQWTEVKTCLVLNVLLCFAYVVGLYGRLLQTQVCCWVDYDAADTVV